MLTIRREQMDALKQVPRKVFTDRMLLHLREYFPVDCERLGKAQTRSVIDFGIERAERHGFDACEDVCCYITLMFIFGSYFDEDPQLLWAAKVLEDDDDVQPHIKINYLCGEATDFLERISGPNGEYYRKVLLKVRRQTLEAYAEINTGDLALDMRTFLSGFYPRKYQEQTEASLERLIDLAQLLARENDMDSWEGVVVCAGLMFMLGSHFDRDPVYPWASAVLADSSIVDPTLKAQRLYDEAMTQLERYLTISQPGE